MTQRWILSKIKFDTFNFQCCQHKHTLKGMTGIVWCMEFAQETEVS